jgi:hypothetical protein
MGPRRRQLDAADGVTGAVTLASLAPTPTPPWKGGELAF